MSDRAFRPGGSPGDTNPMPGIVPRWEWRTFGERFGAADERLGHLVPELVQDSAELYLLSLRGSDTVKIRDGLIDVKHLEQVWDAGLERWMPILKAAFPLAAHEINSVLTALGISSTSQVRGGYTQDDLIVKLVDPTPDLMTIEVHKRRRHYTLDDCMVELTDVTTDQGETRTVAVESEDPKRVLATVRALGLQGRPNVNYPRGLKALAGFGARRRAVIDVGTNSVKFHVAEHDANDGWRTVVDRAEVTRLGEGLDETGQLNPQPEERTIAAIAAMADEARRVGALDIEAVGTAGLRIAPNTKAFVAAVEARCGVHIEVISGEEESRIAYLAVSAGIDHVGGSLAVFDTGGGSSQFTFGHADVVDERFSVNVGAVSFTERFGLDRVVSEDVLAATLDAISGELTRLDDRPAPDRLVGIGGAITNLAAVKHRLVTYAPDIVRGTVLDLAEIDRQIEVYRTRTSDERRQIAGLQPKRAEVILAGACIVRTVLTKLGSESVTASDRGLRHGLLIERFGP